MGVPPVLGFQNPPVTTTSNLDATLLEPTNNTTGLPVVRENVQQYISSERRRLEEMDCLALLDANKNSTLRRHTERITLVDSRGGVGRGTTR